MVRLLGIILNLSLIGVLFFLLNKGLPDRPFEIALALLLVLTPIFNLVFLFSPIKRNGEKGLLRLYLERRALEEKARIDKLRADSAG